MFIRVIILLTDPAALVVLGVRGLCCLFKTLTARELRHWSKLSLKILLLASSPQSNDHKMGTIVGFYIGL